MVSQKNLGFWYTVCKGKKLGKSKEKLRIRESKKMHKKHIFLSVFSKTTIFACVFCTLSAWADTTTCDINYTPVTGNSWQNGTPTPTSPVDVISVGDKTVNLWNATNGLNEQTLGGVTYHTNPDGSITISGTATAYGLYLLAPFYITDDIKNKTIVISGLNDGISVSSNVQYGDARIYFKDGTYSGLSLSNLNPTVINLADYPNANYLYVGLKRSGNIATSGTVKPYIIEGSTAPTSYVPYGYEIPVAGTSANGSRTTTSVYLDEPLRKVGDYADVLDYKNGTITRNVGVKVLDGTESWGQSITANHYGDYFYTSIDAKVSTFINTHFASTTAGYAYTHPNENYKMWIENPAPSTYLKVNHFESETAQNFKAYLAQQYANGTPVTVYYPLRTPVVEQIENWSCIPPITEIKIATTKMVDDEFKAAEAKLATTVQTIESVVSRTISQTEQIQILQDTKQTRPDESCPANMKCLLVQDEDGTPHWYPIIEP
ncbi:MAG: hypothetical protein KBT14_03195 [Proteobacteria bacterium]|nr:hypothetical protein [Candidatus Enterousia onthequi]